jgi:hypothetical protein
VAAPPRDGPDVKISEVSGDSSGRGRRHRGGRPMARNWNVHRRAIPGHPAHRPPGRDPRGGHHADFGGLVQHNTICYEGASFARQIGMLPTQGPAADRALTAVFNAKTRLSQQSRDAGAEEPLERLERLGIRDLGVDIHRHVDLRRRGFYDWLDRGPPPPLAPRCCSGEGRPAAAGAGAAARRPACHQAGQPACHSHDQLRLSGQSPGPGRIAERGPRQDERP